MKSPFEYKALTDYRQCLVSVLRILSISMAVVSFCSTRIVGSTHFATASSTY